MGVQRYWYSGDNAGRIIFGPGDFLSANRRRILSELTYIWMNFSGDVLSAIASLMASSANGPPRSCVVFAIKG